jgi:D-beta-D-heptose 7-phosphate kinase/D-beta-D-heptose 1-phosphate adenosyltransferase
MGRIVTDWNELRGKRLVATSGGFDPLHVGHLRCFQASAELVKENDCHGLVVIVNGDGWLRRKKGQPFMPCQERMEIIAGIEGIDWVVEWDDGGPTVTGAIDKLQPVMFTKGGDRKQGGPVTDDDYRSSNVPEFALCGKIGCKVVFSVGGGKIQSSSHLTKDILPTEWTGLRKEKPWGYEVWWTPQGPQSPYAGKILVVNPGERMSLQYHEKKEETCLVLSGQLRVEGDVETVLGPGQVFHVPTGQVHRFGALGGVPCVLVEVSTNDMEDVVRLQDDYGRNS